MALKIAGIVGSLRKGSYNRALLRVAQLLAPEGLSIEALEIGELPLYNGDIENSPPPAVAEFKKKIEASNALLIVTPEYNYSVPGVLKNAIDWATRPKGQSSVTKKLTAMIGASDGMHGTSRAQYHLRQILHGSNMLAMQQPQLFVSFCDKKFDAQGNLTDEETKKKLGEFLIAFEQWVGREKRP